MHVNDAAREHRIVGVYADPVSAMEEVTGRIAVARRIDLPGMPEPMAPGDYRLTYRVEADPVDDRQVYYHGGEAVGLENDRRYLLWGYQVEALLQSPHVTRVEMVSSS